MKLLEEDLIRAGGARLMAGPEPQAEGRGIGGDQSQSVPACDVTVGLGPVDEPVIQRWVAVAASLTRAWAKACSVTCRAS